MTQHFVSDVVGLPDINDSKIFFMNTITDTRYTDLVAVVRVCTVRSLSHYIETVAGVVDV